MEEDKIPTKVVVQESNRINQIQVVAKLKKSSVNKNKTAIHIKEEIK